MKKERVFWSAVVAIAVGAAVWQHRVATRLSTRVAALEAAASRPPGRPFSLPPSVAAGSASAPVSSPPSGSGAAPEWREKIAASEAQLAPLRDQIVVSYGTVAEVGQQLGRMIAAAPEARRLGATPPAQLDEASRTRWLDLQRQRSTFEGELPEIAALQDRPDDYAAFFASAFQEAAGLDDVYTGRVLAYMRGRALQMGDAGLNQARMPADAPARSLWEDRRDAFNEETMAGLLDTLPPGTAQRLNLDDEFLEYLEMDFDKASGVTKTP